MLVQEVSCLGLSNCYFWLGNCLGYFSKKLAICCCCTAKTVASSAPALSVMRTLTDLAVTMAVVQM